MTRQTFPDDLASNRLKAAKKVVVPRRLSSCDWRAGMPGCKGKSGTVQFIDATAGSVPQRFYRATSP